MTSKRALAILVLIAIVAVLVFYLRGPDTSSTTPQPRASASSTAAAKTSASRHRVARPLRGTVEQRIDLSGAARTEQPGSIGRIEGQVLSHSRREGVPGAQLTFDNGSLHRVTADARGQFSFLPPAEGVYELMLVTAKGYLPLSAEEGHGAMVFTARRGAGLSGARVFLVPAIDYTVKVVTAGETPVAVAEATVRLLGAEAAEDPAAKWTTNTQGEAVIVARDGAIVAASHPDHGTGRARLDFGAQVSHRLTITVAEEEEVARQATLSGTVLADGEPVADALVTAAFRADNPAKTRASLEPSRSVRTDEAGQFTFEALRAGRYDLVASAAGYAPMSKRSVAAPATGVVLQLEQGGRLLGQVTAQETDAPIASFVVVVQERLGPLRQEVVVAEPTFDPNGEYDIPALPSGSFVVSIMASGFAPSAERQVVIGSEDVRADFAMARGETLSGIVVDEASEQPIKGARVSLEGSFGGRRSVQLYSSTTTNAQGQFTLLGVAPGPQSLLAAAANHHGKLVSVEVKAGATESVRIVLPPTEEGEEPRIELAGIGAVLSAAKEVLVIGRVIETGGAFEAGLGPDDAILAVDGVPVVELGFAGSIRKIRGPVGSVVLLTIRKAGSDEPANVSVTRRKIRSP